MKIEDLNQEYDKMQQKYGAQELDSIYNGGCTTNPDICFVFMNPTGKNIASVKSWHGRKSPWLGTKNIWKLFYNVNLLTENTYQQIMNKKPKDWDYAFCDYVYNELEQKKVFITNLGKCTQVDARPLSDEVLNKSLDLLLKEIDIVKPRIIITFGNQVSSIILNTKISVSQSRKTPYDLNINKTKYKVYPVYYPVGNGIFNIDKAIEEMVEVIPEYQCLTSVPGVGKVYAAGIIAEIGQIERFKDHPQVAKYAGLNWKQNQSGNTNSQNTELVKRGNRYLRYYLVEAANSVRRHDSEYQTFYKKKYHEVPKHQHKRAIVLTARKFVRLVDALLRNRQLYTPPRRLMEDR